MMVEQDSGSSVDEKLVDGKGDHTTAHILALGPEPTEEELATLPKVSDRLPFSAWLVAIVELCERFCYFGITGPFQNYMQLDRGNTLQHGGLGLGQSTATALSYFFQFWCYVTPILGAVIADTYWGKYKTIVFFASIYILGNVVLFITSLPFSLDNNQNAGMAGLVVAMVIIGLGTGGIKPNVSPMIAEQYTNTKPYVKTLKNGKRVIIDPAVTLSGIFMVFYCSVNIGSLSNLATTELEQRVDFWAAFILPFSFFFLGVAAILAGRKYYIKRPPGGSVIPDAFRIVFIACVNKFKFEHAKPSYRQEHGMAAVGWSDLFVDEVRRSLYACSVFVFYPIYWVVYGQMASNFVSQAGQMETHGMPNDIMTSIDSIAIILFIPPMERWIYPWMRRHGIMFKPITRILWGFIMAALAMAYAAIVQHLIYSAGPCYEYPLKCAAAHPDSGKPLPNRVHIAIQTPAYVFIALSEIFASVSGQEYAYTKAPANMKSFIMSLFLLTNAVGSALGIALSPTAKNPKLMWMYIGLCVATIVAAALFWWLFSGYNKVEDELNLIDAEYTAELNANLAEEKETLKNKDKV